MMDMVLCHDLKVANDLVIGFALLTHVGYDHYHILKVN